MGYAGYINETYYATDEMSLEKAVKFAKTMGKRKYRKYLAPTPQKETPTAPIPKGIFEFPNEGIDEGKKTRALALAAALGASLLGGACNTADGVKKDINAARPHIENAYQGAKKTYKTKVVPAAQDAGAAAHRTATRLNSVAHDTHDSVKRNFAQ